MPQPSPPPPVRSADAPATQADAPASLGLYALKPWYTRRLTPILRAAERAGLSPDALTAAAVLAAIGAGAAIAAGCWMGAAVLLAVRLAGANLDGALARRRGLASSWGFVLNEVGDRAADLAMFAGLAGLAWRTGTDGSLVLVLVLVAALAATLPTFASLALAGAGAPRANGGPLGKTERCLLAVIATAIPHLLGVLAVLLIAGSVLTAGMRLYRGHRQLTRDRSATR